MFRALLRPRYVMLTALMLVVAALCIVLGTWQIARFETKRSENSDLRNNDHASAVPVASLVPLVGSASPSKESVEFRQVNATGSFDAASTQYVRQRSAGGDTGYYVLTPLTTGGGTLLVVRGFISGTASTAAPHAPAPPAGTVRLTGRLQLAQTRNDKAATLPDEQIESINPTQQGQRLAVPVYDAWLQEDINQPGTDGLTALDQPDLSNPAGGAMEPQHLAYIIQWYLFAALAIAAPFAMIRADLKREEREIDDEPTQAPDELAQETLQARQARTLAERYGR